MERNVACVYLQRTSSLNAYSEDRNSKFFFIQSIFGEDHKVFASDLIVEVYILNTQNFPLTKALGTGRR